MCHAPVHPVLGEPDWAVYAHLGKGVVWLHVTNKNQLAVTKEQAT